MIELGDIISRPITYEGKSTLLDLLRSIDLKDKAWVAGGAALRLAMGVHDLNQVYFGGESADVDIFCASYDKQVAINDQLRELASEVIKKHGVRQFQVCRSMDKIEGMTFHLSLDEEEKDFIPVQVIEFELFHDMRAIFKSFDFTVCMFATDGFTVSGPEIAWEDLAAKRLRLNLYREDRKTIHRVAKYAALGFTPEPGLLTKLFTDLPNGYIFSPDQMNMTRKNEAY